MIGGLLGGQTGALIGAGAGGLTGGLIGHHFDKENEELRQRLVGSGIQVKKQGKVIILLMSSDITFGFNKTEINPRFFAPLQSIAVVLRKYKNNMVSVIGYTDNIGNPSYNQILSENRAAAIGNYLISQGIPVNHVFIKGYGTRYPIASNASSSGRAMNRRVTITLSPTN